MIRRAIGNRAIRGLLRSVYYSTAHSQARRIIDPIIMRYRYSSQALRAREEFLKLHLGCGTRRFQGYINIDFRKTRAVDYVCDAGALPFPDNSVGLIETYHMIEHLPASALARALDNWWRILVPGGKIVIECPDYERAVEEYLRGNDQRLYSIFGRQRFPGDAHLSGWNHSRLAGLLQKHGFTDIRRAEPQDYHRLEEPCLRVEAYKGSRQLPSKDPDAVWREKKERRPETLTVAWREKHIHTRILHELKHELFEGKRVLSLGCGSGELEAILGRDGHSIIGLDVSGEALEVGEKHRIEGELDNVCFVGASIDNLPFASDSFDTAYMIEVLEHVDPADVGRAFSEIRRVLKPDARLLITVPNKAAYADPRHVQFFTKGRLCALLDQHGLSVEWAEWETREDDYRQHDMLKALVSNKGGHGIGGRKICALGAYCMRYDQLGFHWDGQARAFDSLGLAALLLDVRGDTHENLRRKIIEFGPDILWVGLKDSLPLVITVKEELRRIGCSVVYWFCDLRGVEGTDGDLPLKEPVIEEPGELGDVIDYMFLSNAGQIEAYRKAYNVQNASFMPQACTPQFMRRIPASTEYEIGFAGSLGSGVFLRGRSRLLRTLSRKYQVRVIGDIRNTIAEFYARCKIVFGADVIGESSEFHPELYTSNRFFVALGCGTFYLCQWFPGIETLAENHQHLVWFKSEEELLELIDRYLGRDGEREVVQRNAERLAHSKHTYVHRVQNMLDIVDGRTGEFYGFL